MTLGIDTTLLTQAPQYVLYWLLLAVVFGSAVAAVAWLLTVSALRSLRPTIHAAIWLVVLAKFVIPAGPGWSYSLANLVGGVTPLPAPPGAVMEASDAKDFTLYELEYKVTSTAGDRETVATTPGSATAQTKASLAPTAGASLNDWPTWLALAYVVGVCVVSTIRIRAYRRFARRARALPMAGRGVRRLVEQACRRGGLVRVPTVRLSEEDLAPFIFGLLKPTLVLPSGQTLAPRELEAVVLHEIAHLRRMDLVIRYVQWLAGTLLFFWPVVAWVNRRLDLAREYACDEWALRHGRLRPGQYARCLLRAVRTAGPPWTAYRPAAMAATKKTIERRIEMIMDTNRRRRPSRTAGMAVGAILLAWTGFVLAGAAPADEPSPQTDQDLEIHEIVVPGISSTAFFSTGPGDGQSNAVPYFMQQISDDGTQEHAFMFRVDREQSPEALAAFAADHPAADTDADGLVTQTERDAYLVALAMSDPDAVLAQFPSADRDEDGALSVDEAAQFVVSVPQMPATMAWTTQPPQCVTGTTTVELQATDNVTSTQTIVIPQVQTIDGNIELRIVASDAETGDPIEVTGEQGHFLTITPAIVDDGGTWVSDNGQPQQIHFNAGAGTWVGDTGDEHVVKIETRDDGGRTVVMEGDPEDLHVHAIGPDAVAYTDDEIPADMQERIDQMRIRFDAQFDDSQFPITGEQEIVIALAGVTPDGPLPFVSPAADEWLLNNINTELTAADVQAYVGSVEQAPLAAFLRMNPEADHNHDGILTAEERDRFIERHMTRSRLKVLEQHPDADLNGDGLLTNDEMHEYFRSRIHNRRTESTDSTDNSPQSYLEAVHNALMWAFHGDESTNEALDIEFTPAPGSVEPK